MEKYIITIKWNKLLNQFTLSNEELGVYERADKDAKLTKMIELRKLAKENNIELEFIEA